MINDDLACRVASVFVGLFTVQGTAFGFPIAGLIKQRSNNTVNASHQGENYCWKRVFRSFPVFSVVIFPLLHTFIDWSSLIILFEAANTIISSKHVFDTKTNKWMNRLSGHHVWNDTAESAIKFYMTFY